MTALLEVRNLNSWYGESHILHGVDMNVGEGETVTILGRNGVGKTTTLRTVTGIVRARKGEIRFAGKDMMQVPLHRTAHHGIGFVPEERGIFSTLNVLENLMLPPEVAKGGMTLDEIFELFPNLHERRNSPGTRLSGGEQQMLAIARALMADPKVLLLDEPSLGLAPLLVRSIFDSVRKINRQGVTVILVEQNARAALKLASRGYVIEVGRVVMEDASEALLANPDVQAAYLGGGQENGQEN